MVEHGFTSMGLHRISSWCIAENGASIGVLRNLGMREEGRLRENEFLKGRWCDTLVFGLIKEEWEDLPENKISDGGEVFVQPIEEQVVMAGPRDHQHLLIGRGEIPEHILGVFQGRQRVHLPVNH